MNLKMSFQQRSRNETPFPAQEARQHLRLFTRKLSDKLFLAGLLAWHLLTPSRFMQWLSSGRNAAALQLRG